jgi:hypothetical protein
VACESEGQRPERVLPNPLLTIWGMVMVMFAGIKPQRARFQEAGKITRQVPTLLVSERPGFVKYRTAGTAENEER